MQEHFPAMAMSDRQFPEISSGVALCSSFHEAVNPILVPAPIQMTSGYRSRQSVFVASISLNFQSRFQAFNAF